MNGVKSNLLTTKALLPGRSELITGDGKGFMEDMELSLTKKPSETNRRREIHRRNHKAWETLLVAMEIN